MAREVHVNDIKKSHPIWAGDSLVRISLNSGGGRSRRAIELFMPRQDLFAQPATDCRWLMDLWRQQFEPGATCSCEGRSNPGWNICTKNYARRLSYGRTGRKVKSIKAKVHTYTKEHTHTYAHRVIWSWCITALNRISIINSSDSCVFPPLSLSNSEQVRRQSGGKSRCVLKMYQIPAHSTLARHS